MDENEIPVSENEIPEIHVFQDATPGHEERIIIEFDSLGIKADYTWVQLDATEVRVRISVSLSQPTTDRLRELLGQRVQEMEKSAIA